VPKAGQTIKEEEIINLCKENLAAFKVPKGVIFMDQLPKTPSGKILKRDLRQLFKDFFSK
jgi:fatty-acyl-CoA synthase